MKKRTIFFSKTLRKHNTQAIIEPRIATVEDMEHMGKRDEVWQSFVLLREPTVVSS